ncbi:hypothetical protein ICN48_02165 [Polynucleobacter sp. JS-Safj-400b-B2]|uniref:hypothetical protein n=1 Tax=Polynucleobacter sp. JS-Safj-400b-B2 TaxID=2576921 RepID=UPI001C0B43CC|nr:hypothetical protein [Polynucleobacter sp. JS-Safj-400b-B2]MBU3625046.1 hypothetical protein [Polynucleobacter sp. JS-Safj-400b-B2]
MGGYLNRPLVARFCFYFAVIGCFGICLYPYAISGFYFDDIYNSLISGRIKYEEVTLSRFVASQFQQWFAVGRFFPVAIIVVSYIWDVCDTLLKYRAIHLAFICLNGFTFFLLIKKLSGDLLIAGFTIVFLPMLFQFNPRWDGITSFGPLNQLAFLLVTCSCLSLVNYLDQSKKIFLVLALVLEFLALSTYEVSIVIIPVQILICFFWRQKNEKLNKPALISTLLVALTHGIICLLLIAMRSSSYDGINVSHHPSVATFFYQFFSALPLSFLGNKVLPINLNFETFFGLSLTYFLLSFLFNATLSRLDGVGKHRLPKKSLLIIFIGILLACVPPFLLALSSRYQTIVSYGDPYIIVYFQYWGVALLFAICATYLCTRFSAYIFIIPLFLLISAICGLTTATNISRIEQKNIDFLNPRKEIQTAVDMGFMEQVKSSDTLIVDSLLPWETGDSCVTFFSMILGRKVDCIFVKDLLNNASSSSSLTDIKTDPKNRFIFSRQTTKGNEEQIRIGSLEGTWEVKKNTIHFLEDVPGLVLGPVLGSGFYGWEPTQRKEWAWSSGNSEISFYNYAGSPVEVKLTIPLQSAINQVLSGFLNGKPLFTKTLNSSAMENVVVEAVLRPGMNSVLLKSAGNAITLSERDPRLFSFRIFSPHILNNNKN